MVVTPNELIRYTRAIQAILTGYSGYVEGKADRDRPTSP